MPDPFDPTPAQPSPDGLASAHVDASTIALLAEVELDAAAIVELVRFLLDDDPDLPPNWHLAALLAAAEHVGSCPACSGVRAGIVGAAVAALAAPVPAGTVAARDAHLNAALAAFDGSIARAPYGDTEARAAGLDTVRTRRPWLRPRAPRAGLGVGPASGGPSAGTPSSTWAFARDRRVLLAVAVVLAISVPLVVNGGRRNRPAASKVADTTTAQTTVADTTAAAARSKAARPTGGVVAQAEGERIGDGLAEADTTSAGADQATTGAAPVIDSADLRASASTVAVPAAPSAPLAAVSTTPVTTQPAVAPVTTPAPSTKLTATPLAAKRSVSTSRPSDALAAAGTTIPAAARTGVLASADATENAGSRLVRDLGNLGSFTDEETALVAYAALGSAAPTGALAAKAPAPVTGDVSAPAAAAAAAPAVSGADGRCLRALIGADTVAHADINGVAILIVSFSEPSPGHVQLLTADGCAVRLDRTR